MASQRSCVRDFFCYFGGCVVSQGRPPRLSPDISALSALTYVKEMLTHGMKGRRGGAEDERKWKGTQKPQETHVGRQAHFSIQRRNPLWPSTIQKVADSQAYSKRPGSQTAHSRVLTVPLHIPRTPFSLALTALFVSDSKGVLLCCVASLFPPFLFGREGTQRWTGSSRPNARRNLFEPLTTSPDTWTTGGSAERSMGAAFGLRALTHLSRPPQAIWGFVMLGFAPVCIRQVRN